MRDAVLIKMYTVSDHPLPTDEHIAHQVIVARKQKAAQHIGRIDAVGSGTSARQWMPLSVEVHHALMDGLHAGSFIQGFEAAMREPLAWLQGTPPA